MQAILCLALVAVTTANVVTTTNNKLHPNPLQMTFARTLLGNTTGSYVCACTGTEYTSSTCTGTPTKTTTSNTIYDSCLSISASFLGVSVKTSTKVIDSCKKILVSETDEGCPSDAGTHPTDGSYCVGSTGSYSTIKCTANPSVVAPPPEKVCRCNIEEYTDAACGTKVVDEEVVMLKNGCTGQATAADDCGSLSFYTAPGCQNVSKTVKTGECASITFQGQTAYMKWSCHSGAGQIVPSVLMLALAIFSVLSF